MLALATYLGHVNINSSYWYYYRRSSPLHGYEGYEGGPLLPTVSHG